MSEIESFGVEKRSRCTNAEKFQPDQRPKEFVYAYNSGTSWNPIKLDSLARATRLRAFREPINAALSRENFPLPFQLAINEIQLKETLPRLGRSLSAPCYHLLRTASTCLCNNAHVPLRRVVCNRPSCPFGAGISEFGLWI